MLSSESMIVEMDQELSEEVGSPRVPEEVKESLRREEAIARTVRRLSVCQEILREWKDNHKCTA